jgi:hypothetical protein
MVAARFVSTFSCAVKVVVMAVVVTGGESAGLWSVSPRCFLGPGAAV